MTFCGSLSNRARGSNLGAVKAKNTSVTSTKREKHYPKQYSAFSPPAGIARAPLCEELLGTSVLCSDWPKQKREMQSLRPLFLFLYKAHPHTPGKKTRNFYFPQTLEACFSSMPGWNQDFFIAYQTCRQSVPAIDFFPGSAA